MPVQAGAMIAEEGKKWVKDKVSLPLKQSHLTAEDAEKDKNRVKTETSYRVETKISYRKGRQKMG